MRRLFIFQIISCLIFCPFSSFALIEGSAMRASTGVISAISSSGAMFGGASGSKIVATATRSFAGGYFASPGGAIASGAAGGYEATAAVALSRGATGGLLRLAFQGAAAGSRMIPYVGAVITAASLAGMAWEWYQGQDGKGHFVQPGDVPWTPVFSGGYLIGTKTISENINPTDGYKWLKGKSFSYYSAGANLAAIMGCSAGALSEITSVTVGTPTGVVHISAFSGLKVYTYNGVIIAKDLAALTPPPPGDKKPVPWDDVQKQIEDDLGNRPNEWADPFADAVKEVPPNVNPWLDKTSKEDAAKTAPNPMPENLPYPTPSGTPSVPNPATGQPMPAPLPNELTKEDISKVASEILKSMSPAQSNNVATGDITQPTPNQDLATQIATAIKNNSPSIPQPPYDVKVINEPTIKIKTEDAWKSDAESAVGSQTDPDTNESLNFDLDLEKYKSKKKDLAFLDTIYDNIKKLPIFTLFQKVPISVSGGSTQFCLSIPKFGNHCVDLDEYSSAFETIGSVCIALCFFTCLAIIFL